MRRWLVVLAFLVSLAPAAHARGLHARIEGPTSDGQTYTVRTYSAHENTPLEPWALAEGVVGGKHVSVLLRLEPTSELGVYRFARRWPEDGRWMIRLCLGHPSAPATVASLRADGTVRSNRLHSHTDGFKECMRALHVHGDRNC